MRVSVKILTGLTVGVLGLSLSGLALGASSGEVTIPCDVPITVSNTPAIQGFSAGEPVRPRLCQSGMNVINSGTMYITAQGYDVNSIINNEDGRFIIGIVVDQNLNSFINYGSVNAARHTINVPTRDFEGNLTGGTSPFIVGNDEATSISVGRNLGTFINTGDIVGRIVVGGRTQTFNNSGTISSISTTSGFSAIPVSGSSGAPFLLETTVSLGGGVDTFINSGTIVGANGLFFGGAVGSSVVNSGTITSTNTDNPIAITFGDGNDSLKILTGSQINGLVMFNGGTDTFDFSDFAGSGTLDVEGLYGENIISGNKIVTWNGQNQIMFAERPEPVMIGIGASRIVGEINQVLTDQLSELVPDIGEGDFVEEPNTAALGYAAAPPKTSAEKAVLSALNTEEPSFINNRQLWTKTFGGASRDIAPTDMFSYFGGALAGGHVWLDDKVTAGALVGAVASKTALISGTQRVTTITGIAGLYGQFNAGVITLDASLIGGLSGSDSERNIVTGGSAETARGVFTSWFLSPSLGVTAPVFVANNSTVSIAAKVSYTGGNVFGYTETGSSQNLTVGATPIGLLNLKLGFEGEVAVQQTDYGLMTLSGSIGGLAQSNLGGTTTSVALPGTPAQDIATPGATNFGVYAGIGLSVPVSNTLSFGASIDTSIRDGGYYSLAGSASILGVF